MTAFVICLRIEIGGCLCHVMTLSTTESIDSVVFYVSRPKAARPQPKWQAHSVCRPVSPSLANGTRSVPTTFRKTYFAHSDLDSETSPHLARMLSRKNLGVFRDFARNTWPRCGSNVVAEFARISVRLRDESVFAARRKSGDFRYDRASTICCH